MPNSLRVIGLLVIQQDYGKTFCLFFCDVFTVLSPFSLQQSKPSQIATLDLLLSYNFLTNLKQKLNKHVNPDEIIIILALSLEYSMSFLKMQIKPNYQHCQICQLLVQKHGFLSTVMRSWVQLCHLQEEKQKGFVFKLELSTRKEQCFRFGVFFFPALRGYLIFC